MCGLDFKSDACSNDLNRVYMAAICFSRQGQNLLEWIFAKAQVASNALNVHNASAITENFQSMPGTGISSTWLHCAMLTFPSMR